MIYNILIACFLFLQSTFLAPNQPLLMVSRLWQNPSAIARVAGIQAPTPTPTPIPVENIDPMVPLINKEREAVNLPDLTENSQLDTSAKAKACDMVDNNYFDHKDKDGQESWHLFVEAGYHYAHAGENLARYYKTDEAAMAKFMLSEKHKDNVLGKDYKNVGIGRCGPYIVQHYGRQ